ncbi:hypothetical protein [Paenibacillus alginolyticus]|uniref:DUF4367 domain-containing protein n=1 Tax=Paenibacillus alginolyticus TaxID=59839 RepID=A0ABT4GM94_9BACL|nr:hypothetical protein [Paenibacillus alginolyticus]MCY9697333.1 hypothetical protein [Paenibacillus alginolyticus]MEC0145248.1 hypothetical protein [Paenibacillus alginolyticus]
MIKMRKALLIILIFTISSLLTDKYVQAQQPKKVVETFINHVIKNEQVAAKRYLYSQSVKIPELVEGKPIDGFNVLTTPQRNDTQIVVAYFKGEPGEERIAFIWEVIVKNEEISYIQVIHDGTKPLLEEAKLVKEYQLKFNRRVLVPTEFPAEVTGFHGYITDKNEWQPEILDLGYGMDSLHSYLHIAVIPSTEDLDRYIWKNTEILKLKDGTKVLYNANFDLGYEIRFQKDGLNYKLSVGKKNLSKKFTDDDLLKIAESMQ